MVEFVTTLLCAFIVPSILFFASQIWFARSKTIVKGGRLRFPPGSMGLPIIGETIEFFLTMWKGHPESFVQDRISRYSSETFRTSVLGDPITIMYGPAGNKFLFANEGKLVKVQWPKQLDGLLGITKAEKFLTKNIGYSIFKSDGLQKHIATMDRVAKQHVEAKWVGQEQVHLHQSAENYTLSLACDLFMSIKDEETIQSLLVPLLSLKLGVISFPLNLPWTQFGRAKRASNLMTERLIPIIQKRRALHLSSDDHHDDFLSHMLSLTDENGENIDDDQIADFIKGFSYGAHDTSTATISLIFSFLADHEDVYNKVLQEQLDVAANKAPGELLNWEDTRKMNYSWNVAREAMRLYPPSPTMYRTVLDDFQHDGYCIPKGSKIQMNLVSTHRDPRFFVDPLKFNPSRFEEGGQQSYTYSPFGGGPRMCPGKDVARAVILIYLHNIITKFSWKKVHVNETFSYNASPRPAYGLPLYLHAHPSSANT